MGMGLGLGHGHALGHSLKLKLECGVCQQEPPKPGEYGKLWIGDREYTVSVTSFLRLQIITDRLLEEGKKFDPLIICPACQEVNDCYRDQNYRRRARRYIKRHAESESPKS